MKTRGEHSAAFLTDTSGLVCRTVASRRFSGAGCLPGQDRPRAARPASGHNPGRPRRRRRTADAVPDQRTHAGCLGEHHSNSGLLERRGWVRRMPHPEDRRSTLVEITDAGRAIADRLLAGIRILERDALDNSRPANAPTSSPCSTNCSPAWLNSQTPHASPSRAAATAQPGSIPRPTEIPAAVDPTIESLNVAHAQQRVLPAASLRHNSGRVQPTHSSEPSVGPGCVKTSSRPCRSGSWPS